MARTKRGPGISWGRWVLLCIIVGLGGWLLFGSFNKEGRDSALGAFEDGDYEAATSLLSRRLGEEKDDDEARYYLGLTYSNRKLTNEAVRELTALRASSTWEFPAYYRVVRAYIDAERIDDALGEVKAVGDRYDKRAQGREVRGLAYFADGRQISKRINDQLDATIGSRETRLLRSLIDRILRAEGPTYDVSVEKLFERLRSKHSITDTSGYEALFLRGHGAYLRAESEFRAAVELATKRFDRPEVPRARFELAEFSRQRGDSRQSEALLQSILDLNVKNDLNGDLALEREYKGLRALTIELLSRILIADERYEEAIATVELVPVNKKGHREYRYEALLALAYSEKGDADKLITITDRWIEEAETPAEMDFLRGRYHFRNGEFERSQGFLERAYNKRSSRRETMKLLSKTYMALDNHDRANEILKRLVELEPNNWEAHLDRAKATEGMQWLEETRSEVTRLLSSQFRKRGTPGHIAVREFLDGFLARHGLVPNDLYTAQKLFDEDPSNTQAGTKLLSFLIDRGDIVRAERLSRKLGERIQSDDPSLFDLEMAKGRLNYRRNRFEESIVSYRAAAQERPYDALAFLGEARAQLAAGRATAAWRAAEKVRILDPENKELIAVDFALARDSEEHERTAELGRQLIASGEHDYEIDKATAAALIALEKPEEAREVLIAARPKDKGGPQADLDYAILLEEAGDGTLARNLMLQVVAANPDSEELLLQTARHFTERGRYREVINHLEPVLASQDRGSVGILEVLAECHRALNEPHGELNAYARMAKIDTTAAANHAAEFCARHGAWAEVLSIADDARSQDRSNTPLLRRAGQAALEVGDLDRAKRIANELEVEVETQFEDNVIMLARLADAAGQFSRAETVLRNAIAKGRATRRAELRLELIDLLGRRGQAVTMMEVLQEASEAKENIAPFIAPATRHLLLLDPSQAHTALDEAIENYGAPREALADRGALRIASGQFTEAAKDLARAMAIHPGGDVATPLAFAYALGGDRRNLARTLAPPRDNKPPLIDGLTRAKAQVIDGLTNNTDWQVRLRAPEVLGRNQSESDSRQSLIFRIHALKDAKRASATKALGAFWALENQPWTRRLASSALGALEEALGGSNRDTVLLRSELMMRDREHWVQGIGIITRLLVSSDYRDEAALLIYLDQYLANGDEAPTRIVIQKLIENGGGSAQGILDASRSLLDAGRARDAARLLQTSLDESVERKVLEARALAASGARERAFALLATIPKDTVKDAEWLRFEAELLATRKGRERSAYQLASRCVNDFPIDGPEPLLTHARCAFQVGRDDEGWESLMRYVDWKPASAQQLARALNLLDEVPPKDAARRTELVLRLRVIDPASQVVRNVQ